MREPKNQMLGTMEPHLMQLSVKHVLVVLRIINWATLIVFEIRTSHAKKHGKHF